MASKIKFGIMGLFSSLFSSEKKEEIADDNQKDDLKNFEILKFDGIKALNIRKTGYAAKCFNEALKIQEDFETMR